MGSEQPGGDFGGRGRARHLEVAFEGVEVVRVLRVSGGRGDDLEVVADVGQRDDHLTVEQLLADVDALAATVDEAVDQQPVDNTRGGEARGVHLGAVLVVLHLQRVAHGVEHLDHARGERQEERLARVGSRRLLAGGVGLPLVGEHHF